MRKARRTSTSIWTESLIEDRQIRIMEPHAVRYILECLSMQSVEALRLHFSGTDQPVSHFTSTFPINFLNLKNLSLIGLITMDHNEWKDDLFPRRWHREELTCESLSFGDAELELLSSPSMNPIESTLRLLPALRCLRMQDIDISWESVVKS